MLSGTLSHLKKRYPDAPADLAKFAQGFKDRAHQRALAANAKKEGTQKAIVARQQGDKKVKQTIGAMRQWANDEHGESVRNYDKAKAAKSIETGAKGGRYYVGENGEKHYVRD